MPIPNVIKYSTTPDSKSLKVGNFSLGVSNSAYGETSSTGYWNGISPPTSGYTIYENKVANGPSIRVPSSSAVLIDYANRLYSGSSITTEAGALTYFNSLNTVICANINYEEIVTSGLTLLLDAGFTPSYPKSGTSWTDLSFSGNNGTLTNGPTFSSTNGGSIVFDGVDDYVQCVGSPTLTAATFVTWIKRNGDQTQYDGILFSRGTNVTGMNFQSSNQLGYHWNNAADTYNWASGLTIPNSTWCMIAVSVSTNSATGYLCQTSGITTATNTTSHASSILNDIKIAQDDAGSRFFNGNIAISQLYNRALSITEITQNFNAQKDRFAPFDPDAQSFFTAAGITDTNQKTAVNQLVLDLKSYGIWEKYSVIYPFVGGSSSTCSYNLKTPSSYQISFYGGWTWNSNGITSGVNSYGDTGFSPYSGFNSDTDYQYSIYSRTVGDSNDFFTLDFTGCDEYGYISSIHNLYIRSSNQLQFYDVDGGYNTRTYSSTDGSGLYTISRTNSTNYVAYRNGTAMTLTGFTSSGAGSRPVGNVVITGINDPCAGISALGTIKNYAFWAMGNGLTSIESSNLYTAVQAFQTTLGRQV